MRNKRNKEIMRVLLHIEALYPKDDLIKSYKDFLLVRDNLRLYRFNNSVFVSLLSLTLDLWKTSNRISRFSLVNTAKKYLENGKYISATIPNDQKLTSESRDLLFEVFKATIDDTEFVTETHISEIQWKVYCMLYQIDLKEEQLKWCCLNHHKSDLVFRKLLNYHTNSEILSKWMNDNYASQLVKGWRSKFASWILDYNQDFEISYQDLISDVRYFNEVDLTYCYNVQLGNDLGMEFSNRLFGVPILQHRSNRSAISDYVDIKEGDESQIEEQTLYFFEHIDTAQCYAMLWAISFSRLNKKDKSRLLIKYYVPELENTFIRICSMHKLSQPLKWLLNKRNKASPERINKKLPEDIEKQKQEIVVELKQLQKLNKVVKEYNLFE